MLYQVTQAGAVLIVSDERLFLEPSSDNDICIYGNSLKRMILAQPFMSLFDLPGCYPSKICHLWQREEKQR